MSMFDRLATALVHTNASWEEVQNSLISACGHPADDEDQDPNSLQPTTDRLGQRERSAVLGVAMYLKLSGGRMQNVLMTFLCKHLRNSLGFSWRMDSKKAAVPVADYLQALVSRMLECLAVLDETRIAELCGTLVRMIDDLLQEMSSSQDHVRILTVLCPAISAIMKAVKASMQWNHCKNSAVLKCFAETILALLNNADLKSTVDQSIAHVRKSQPDNHQMLIALLKSSHLNCTEHVAEVVASVFFEFKQELIRFGDQWNSGLATAKTIDPADQAFGAMVLETILHCIGEDKLTLTISPSVLKLWYLLSSDGSITVQESILTEVDEGLFNTPSPTDPKYVLSVIQVLARVGGLTTKFQHIATDALSRLLSTNLSEALSVEYKAAALQLCGLFEVG